jgi:predicted RNA-binding protein YlqC (UPF0109 family)
VTDAFAWDEAPRHLLRDRDGVFGPAYTRRIRAAPAMKELVHFLAQRLVNDPDAVEVKEKHGDTASVLELRAAKEDLGRVIGKQGRTVNAIRTILNAVASRVPLLYSIMIYKFGTPLCVERHRVFAAKPWAMWSIHGQR